MPAVSFKRILVPMDFSAHARHAAVVAGDLAKQLGARIRFITVLDVSDLRVALKARLHNFATSAELRAAVEKWVVAQYAAIEVRDGVSYTHVVQRGIAEQQILAAIRSYRPHLVVMGSSGLARRLPVGSKTAEVLRRSSVPVLVCRG
jgi:nucleotide-binding universal stress UspA family protein